MEQSRGDPAFGPQDSGLEVDGIGKVDVRHGQGDGLELEALVALAPVVVVARLGGRVARPLVVVVARFGADGPALWNPVAGAGRGAVTLLLWGAISAASASTFAKTSSPSSFVEQASFVPSSDRKSVV